MFMCYVTREPDIPGYSGFYPRINGYIVNCIRKNTKVAENFVLRCLLHPIQRKSGMLLLVRLQLRSLSVELLQLN